jgi:predicted RNA binding protein YcfA (HicA-like mRNA interferase family)
MSNKLPVVSGKKLIKLLEKLGFQVVRIKGSHHRLLHPDGRVTTVPVHKNEDISRGLTHKIITEDVGISIDEYIQLIK